MTYQKFSLLFGFSVWFMATLTFSLWGDLFFLVENALLLISFFIGTVPILFFLSQWVFKKYQLTGHQRLESTVFLAIPGMLCDVACLKFHALIFPKLTLEQSVILGAWILWAYVILLLIGVLKSRNNKEVIKQVV
ncbi:DUF5367 domain-containing protein [Flammeovirga sp. SJP92]|uniref:DUF5367 domain-containing protein n=1 Tax=Flammeovirga sp. SJP92 TaxID=1775430 RepID=UPI000788CCA2|nr:DUF5367 domain-containing protein [Flammeovirga sp. SJP92]KXX71059.1 hypothetical protein AVL50_10680 [Flammeovirga sp. SJP92]